MLEKVPTKEEIIALIGQPLSDVWTKLTNFIESKYDMDVFGTTAGRNRPMSINTAEAGNLYALCTQRTMYSVL